jgi:hypothetical protein
MVRNTMFAANLLLLATFTPVMAQRGGGSVPEPGTMLPTVIAFDEQGETFSTASLRGSYTVLVFGCLT